VVAGGVVAGGVVAVGVGVGVPDGAGVVIDGAGVVADGVGEDSLFVHPPKAMMPTSKTMSSVVKTFFPGNQRLSFIYFSCCAA
jgi:hypothetical protein